MKDLLSGEISSLHKPVRKKGYFKVYWKECINYVLFHYILALLKFVVDNLKREQRLVMTVRAVDILKSIQQLNPAEKHRLREYLIDSLVVPQRNVV